MSTTEFEAWLDNTPEITEPTAEQLHAARAILNSDGMRVLWGMLVATAQGKRIQLENASLATPQDAHRAAVIQGSIKGIYVLRDTMLEIANMGSQPAAPSEETRIG